MARLVKTPFVFLIFRAQKGSHFIFKCCRQMIHHISSIIPAKRGIYFSTPRAGIIPAERGGPIARSAVIIPCFFYR